jgi:hypothetical protein
VKSFPNFSWSALIVVFALAVSGCASGPKYADMQPNIQAPSGENGRIYVYRTSVFGAAIQPSVKINGEVVGDAVPDGFFYVDRPPGNYKITTTTEVERDLSLALEPGQTRYVRLAISMGFFAGHVSPELVDSTEGQKDISTLHYTGK